MRRRELLVLVGSAMAVALPAGAQQKAMPVVGYLAFGTPDSAAPLVAAFRQGLSETGYVEGQNVAIEFRGAEGDYDRLPALAVDLVARKVDVIVATAQSALAARNATSTIPIVFAGLGGGDPIKHGLAAAFNHPGGNATGVDILVTDLVAKRLGLLRELVPSTSLVALFVYPDNPNVETQAAETVGAAHIVGLQVEIVKAATEQEIAGAFASLGSRAQAVVVGPDPSFFNRRNQIVALAAQYKVPAIYELRQFVEAGGLVSYGPDIADADRQLGVYTGKVLAGASPSDLPVEQPTTFELVVNVKTAKALGLTVPPSILARADEVIE
jgi:putative ABC transport system substrate-binding protein